MKVETVKVDTQASEGTVVDTRRPDGAVPVITVTSGLPEAPSRAEKHLRLVLTESESIVRASQGPSADDPGKASGQPVEVRRESQFSERERPPAPPVLGSGRLVSTAATPGQREDQNRAELRADEAREVRLEALRDSGERSNERAAQVAGNTGAVQNSGTENVSAPEPELLGSKVAEATFTQAGAVEAQRADAIATRFLQGQEPAPEDRPGAEPRNRETLSERSVPVSYFA